MNEGNFVIVYTTRKIRIAWYLSSTADKSVRNA